MALATIATIGTIAAAATSIAGAAYAATRSGPTQPNGYSSSRQVAQAQADALPEMLRLQQLEQMGGRGTVNMPAGYGTQRVVEVTTGREANAGGIARSVFDLPTGFIHGIGDNTRDTREVVPYVESEWEPGGKYYDQRENGQAPWYYMPGAGGATEMDFTGYGTADIQGKAARDQADLEIALGQKYGTQFAEQSRALQEQADPLGTQARALEFELLQKDMPVSPLSGMLNEQIDAQVKAGRGLDPMSRDLLDASVRDANAARGGSVGANAVANSMSTGAEGQARLNAATAKGGQFLASGQTPEDIDFRRTQQGIANLGSFVNGQTPQSQFGNIARSNQGATPITGAQNNATMPNNAGQVGNSYANNAYAANANAAMQTPSWMAGLSSMLTSIGSVNTGRG